MKFHTNIGRAILGGALAASLALASVPLTAVSAQPDYPLWQKTASQASIEAAAGGAAPAAGSDMEYKYVPVRRY